MNKLFYFLIQISNLKFLICKTPDSKLYTPLSDSLQMANTISDNKVNYETYTKLNLVKLKTKQKSHAVQPSLNKTDLENLCNLKKKVLMQYSTQ